MSDEQTLRRVQEMFDKDETLGRVDMVSKAAGLQSIYRNDARLFPFRGHVGKVIDAAKAAEVEDIKERRRLRREEPTG